MKTKWASCSTSGAISFSADLLTERRAFGEAVIVHELLHLRVRNHGPLFRSLLGAILPSMRHLRRFRVSAGPHHHAQSASSSARPMSWLRIMLGRARDYLRLLTSRIRERESSNLQ